MGVPNDMGGFAALTRPVPPEMFHFLGRALRWLRWTALAVLLLITLMRPPPSRNGVTVFRPYCLCDAFFNS